MTGGIAAWRGRQGACAAAVILVMVAVRGKLLAGSYFNQDDFYMTGRAYESDLTWGYLFRDFAGHVNPLQQLALWLVAHGSPYRWPVLAVAILCLVIAASVLAWLILTRLLGERWSRVVLLAVFAWSPLTLAPTLWWSASMFLWPHVVCSLAAVWLLVRWRQGDGGRWTSPILIVAVTVIGLLWHERAVLIPPLLFGVAVALADEASGWRRLTAALGRFALLWWALGATLVGFLAAHSALTEIEGGGGTLRQQLGIAWSFLGRSVVPGLLGGPWTGSLDGGAVAPATWVTGVSLILAAAVVALLLWRGGPARRWGLAVLLGYLAADLALLLSGRASFGPIIGLDPRYSSDTVHAAVLCLALSLRGSPPWLGLRPPGPRLRALAVGGLVAAYGVAAAFGTALLVPHFQNTEDRAFVTNLRADLAADPTQVIVDELAPAELVLPLVGDDSRYSHIFGPLPERPAFDQPSHRLRVVDEDGHLAPVVFDGSVPAEAGRDGDCGYRLAGISKRVAFSLPLEGRLVVRVRYFSDAESTVRVTAEEWATEFLARRGPNEIWFVLPDLDGQVDSIGLDGDGRGTVCVTDVDAGLPEAP